MIIRRIEIENFRSYYGNENIFEFGDGLTLIIGDNGDGNSGGRRFVAIKCYMSDATQGSSGYICPEGTGRGVYTDCPTETKTVELYSLSGHCLREITN